MVLKTATWFEEEQVKIPEVNVFEEAQKEEMVETQEEPKATVATKQEAVVERWTTTEEPVELEVTRETFTDIQGKQNAGQALTDEEKVFLGKIKARRDAWESIARIFWEEERKAETLLSETQAQDLWARLASGQDKALEWLGLAAIQFQNNERVASVLKDQGFTDNQINQIIARRDAITAWEARREVTQERISERQRLAQEQADRDIERTREQTQRLQNQTQRLRSLRGVGRSTATEEDIIDLERRGQDLVNAVQAQADLKLQAIRMEEEWAEAEAIQAINKQIAENEILLQEQLTASIDAQKKIDEQLGSDFNTAIDNMLWVLETAWVSISADDLAKTKAVNAWYWLNADWSVKLNADWEPFIYKAVKEVDEVSKLPNFQFVPAKIDNVTWNVAFPAGYFNKATWEFKTINYWGQTGVWEFPTTAWVNPEQWGWKQTNIAEYTQIYKWSPANPNWLDLAGNKWSVIKTPVSWKVIFVWDAWDWWTQVRIQDSEWNIHQFSHLDSALLQDGQVITAGSMLGTMWNTWNVLKWDWSTPTEDELAQWRWTHLDYTVYDENDNALWLDVAMWYAWIENTSWKTSPTADAISKWYKTPTQVKLYNKILSEWGTPPDLSSTKLTEWQSKSVWFANRMSTDIEIMKNLKDEITKLDPIALATYRKVLWTTFGNQFVPPKIQQFLQAESDFLKAQLRQESGAAIPISEEESFIRTNGILPGDSKAVVNQKFNNLENMLESMLITAWPWASLIKKEDIPDGLDEWDMEFFWEDDWQWAVFDQTDIDFFENLDIN